MIFKQAIKTRLRQIWGVALFLSMMAYFVFHAFRGEYSLPALKRLQQQEIALIAESKLVQQEREDLKERIDLLKDSSLDPDMLEEQVRKRLGFAHPDEVVVFIK
jgi:cell division protein FtsB